MNQRNQTIDLAKGMAIILMVVGHCYSQETSILRLIYAFHMPFFFIISGMLYADKWNERIDFHFGRTCRRLMIPYAVFDTLYCVVITILARPDNVIGTVFRNCIYQVISLRGATATWFLPAQLMTLCLFVFIAKRGKKHAHIVIFFALLATALLVPLPDIMRPLRRSMIGVGFFAVGFYGKAFFVRKADAFVLACAAAVYYLLVQRNGMVTLIGLKFSNPALYVVNSLLGSYLLYQLSMLFPWKRLAEGISCLGRNSVVVLCTHMFAVEIIRLFDYKLLGDALKKLGIFEGFIFGGAVLMLMFPVIAFCNRYCFKLFGK